MRNNTEARPVFSTRRGTELTAATKNLPSRTAVLYSHRQTFLAALLPQSDKPPLHMYAGPGEPPERSPQLSSRNASSSHRHQGAQVMCSPQQ